MRRIVFLSVYSCLFSLNKYIGLKNITQKATRIAQEDGIKNYYFYKLRSGKNLDSYLNKQINEVDLPTIDSLSGKQNFILFVNRNTLKKESKLYNFSNNHIQLEITVL